MSLKQICETLLSRAEREPDVYAEIQLARGLLVEAMVQPREGLTYVRISRPTAYPSEAEWRAVINAWPYPVAAEFETVKIREVRVLPEGSTQRGPVRKGLVGSWPTQERMKL